MDDQELLDCAHWGTPAGVCQYRRCGKILCARCTTECANCGRTLCPAHRKVKDYKTFCPECAVNHTAKKIAKTAGMKTLSTVKTILTPPPEFRW